jgi:hypothetical protein
MNEKMIKAQKSGFPSPKIRFSLIDFYDRILYGDFNAKTLFTFANDSQQHLIPIANSPVLFSAVNFFLRKSQIRREAKTESHGSHADSRVA